MITRKVIEPLARIDRPFIFFFCNNLTIFVTFSHLVALGIHLDKFLAFKEAHLFSTDWLMRLINKMVAKYPF